MEAYLTEATEQDKGAIKKLWQETFEGIDAEHLRYLEQSFIPQSKILLLKGEEILSTLVLTPIYFYKRPSSGMCDFKSKSEGYYVSYVVTPKHYRGRGFCERLFKLCEPLFKEKDFLVLRPASRQLSMLYSKLGFDNIFSCQEYIISHDTYDFQNKFSATEISCDLFLERTALYDIASTFNLSQLQSSSGNDRIKIFKLPETFPVLQMKCYRDTLFPQNGSEMLFIDGGF